MTAAAASPLNRDDAAEVALLARAREGDPDAFTQIVRRYQVPVYRAALAALGSPADAEEAAQDAFVAAFRRLGTFRGASSFKTWLIAIAWRKALTRRRRMQWRRLWTVAPSADDAAASVETAVDPAAGPELEALGADLRQQLKRLVQSLPVKLRDPLLLVAAGDHTYEEIAIVLRIPAGTAKWRVSEARRVLRENLQQLGYHR